MIFFSEQSLRRAVAEFVRIIITREALTIKRIRRYGVCIVSEYENLRRQSTHGFKDCDES